MSELPLEITCSEVKAKLDAQEDFLLIDCRETEEHALAAIPSAMLLPMSEIQSRVGELEAHRTKHVVVHCHHGMRSAQVAGWLRGQGVENAQSMSGGIDRWAVEIEPGTPRY